MTRAIRLTCLSLLLVGLAGTAALAKPSIAILGLEVIDKQGTPSAQDTQVAQDLTQGLRERAKAGTGPYQIAVGSEKELIDEKLLKNCDDEKPACMAAIGTELNAEYLMYGRIEKSGGSYKVSVVLLDVKAMKKDHTFPDIIPLPEATGTALKVRARKIYAALTGQNDSCVIAVKTTGGADRGTILVNGETKGNITNGTGQVTGLSEGKYKIAVEAQDFHRFEKSDVTCTAGVTTNVSAEMQKMVTGEVGIGPGGQGSGSGSGSGSDFHSGSVSHSNNNAIWKAIAWGGVVGTAVGGGVWIYGFAKASGADGFDANHLNTMGANTTLTYNQAQCGTSDGNIVAGNADLAGFNSNTKFKDGCSGNKISKIGIGLTIGFGIVGAVGIVMAYARGGGDEKPVSVTGTGTVGHRTKKRPPFAIVPVASPQGGGATFAMEW